MGTSIRNQDWSSPSDKTQNSTIHSLSSNWISTIVLRFFTLVETNQPSGENRNKDTPGALADKGLKVGMDGSLTKNAWNLVRSMTKQRYEVAQVWLKITSLAESRSKAGLGTKPNSISNLRSKLGTQVGTYIYYCGLVHGPYLDLFGIKSELVIC